MVCVRSPKVPVLELRPWRSWEWLPQQGRPFCWKAGSPTRLARCTPWFPSLLLSPETQPRDAHQDAGARRLDAADRIMSQRSYVISYPASAVWLQNTQWTMTVHVCVWLLSPLPRLFLKTVHLTNVYRSWHLLGGRDTQGKKLRVPPVWGAMF